MGWGSGTANFTYLVTVSPKFEKPSNTLTCYYSPLSLWKQSSGALVRTVLLYRISSTTSTLRGLATSRGLNLLLLSLSTRILAKNILRLTATSEIGMSVFDIAVPSNVNISHRKNLTAWHGGDALVLAVAAQNQNTIVVVHSVGPLILEPWVEHPNVTAVSLS